MKLTNLFEPLSLNSILKNKTGNKNVDSSLKIFHFDFSMKAIWIEESAIEQKRRVLYFVSHHIFCCKKFVYFFLQFD